MLLRYKNNKELPEDKYIWDEDNRIFSTQEEKLILDFSEYDSVTFNIKNNCKLICGSDCVIKAGSFCKFETQNDCTFSTLIYNDFQTGDGCVFRSGRNCSFDTGIRCVFKTGNNSRFITGHSCIFNSGADCSFEVEQNCDYNTLSHSTFKSEKRKIYDSFFDTGHSCHFDFRGKRCIFKTLNNCSFIGVNGIIFRKETSEVITLNGGKIRLKARKGYNIIKEEK